MGYVSARTLEKEGPTLIGVINRNNSSNRILSNVFRFLIVKEGEWGVLVVNQASKDINWLNLLDKYLKFTGGDLYLLGCSKCFRNDT